MSEAQIRALPARELRALLRRDSVLAESAGPLRRGPLVGRGLLDKQALVDELLQQRGFLGGNSSASVCGRLPGRLCARLCVASAAMSSSFPCRVH